MHCGGIRGRGAEELGHFGRLIYSVPELNEGWTYLQMLWMYLRGLVEDFSLHEVGRGGM